MGILSTQVMRGADDIGPYQILADLGPAPFGSLYLALDTRSDRRTLLKVIPPSRLGVAGDSAPWEILLHETQALFRIYRRGLPALLEVAELEGSLLVAIAPVAGVPLHDLLARGERPDRALLVDWGCQLLEVLGEAHAEGIVHRHVGEDQVLVAPEGHLVLTGFGLTPIFFDSLAPFPAAPSPAEASTPQADLYAVGLLLRRLAFASVLKGGGGSPGGSRDPLLKVLARATFPDPAARFHSAAEMAEALRQAGRTGSSVIAARRERPEVVATPRPRIAFLPSRGGPARTQDEETEEDRRSALLLVAAALLLMLTVIATGWLLIGHGAAPRPDAVRPAAGTSSAHPKPPPTPAAA